MFGHYYCQICGTTHDDWERMDKLMLCNKCKHWKSVRRFYIVEPSHGVFADKHTFFYYDIPADIKLDAMMAYEETKNMLDWNNIGLITESMNWINRSIINREQYVRFAITEFYAEGGFVKNYLDK